MKTRKLQKPSTSPFTVISVVNDQTRVFYDVFVSSAFTVGSLLVLMTSELFLKRAPCC